MKTGKRLRTTLLVAMSILLSLPCVSQDDGGGKKQKKPVKTEQRTSNNTKQKQQEIRRQQEAEAKRKQEEARRQQEAERRKPKTGSINGPEWVDLGLSVKWATCNVGASKPSDYGNYYAWGETSPKSSYNWSNCFDCLDSSSHRWGIYKLTDKTQITPISGHDAARENWGGSWRMPTDSELEELNTKCTWKWTEKDGHNGYLVTGPNGRSIFFPAAGSRDGADFYGVGERGYYWSSSLSTSYSYNARGLYFYFGFHHVFNYSRRLGLSVRPVTD